jgi:hypothetical protein
MATRGKRKPENAETKRRRQDQGVQAKPDEPKLLRKAIYLSALIYVEGDQSPPEDFAALTTSALKKRQAEAIDGEHEGMRMTLKKVEPRHDIEEDGEEEEKFQF